MGSRSGDAVQAYSTLGPTYDADRHENRLLAAGRQQSVARLLDVMPPSGDLLELGAGTGEEAAALASQGRARVLAVEPAASMARHIVSRARTAGLEIEVRAQKASQALTDLRRTGRRFDGAWASFALAYDAPLSELVEPLRQVLRPGAPLVLSLPNVWTLSAPWRVPTRLAGTYRHKVGAARVPVHCYAPREAIRMLSSRFDLVGFEAMAVFVPPARLWKAWRLLGPVATAMERLDAAASTRSPWRSLGDHTLFVFRARPS